MGQLEKYGLYVLVIVIVMILGVALMGEPGSDTRSDLKVADIKVDGDGDRDSRRNPAPGAQDAEKPSDRLLPVFGDFQDGDALFTDASGTVQPPKTDPKVDPATPDVAIPPSRDLGGSDRDANRTPKVDPGALEESGKIAAPPLPVPSTVRKHKIVAGDTPSSLAQQYLGSARYFQQILDANPGVDPRRIQVGTELVIPAAARKEVAPAKESGESRSLPQGARKHLIVPGDTLASLAIEYLGAEREWRKIADANPGLDPTRLPLNREIVIPARGAAVATEPKATKGRATTLPPGAVLHEVAAGETLTHVSRRYYGSDQRWQVILDANPGLDPRRMPVGREIVVPALSPPRN
ncbi:MAG: LysM peptidoglycan-binding domain-containing protein [Planctomycetota bacterium]